VETKKIVTRKYWFILVGVLLAQLALAAGATGAALAGEEGTLKWRYKVGSTYTSPAIGQGGTVYVSSWGNLYAFSPEGTLKWLYPTGNSWSPVIGQDGTIYVGSGLWEGYVYAINPDCNLKWRYQTPTSISCESAIGADGTIYTGSYDAFYALNPDGTLKWKYPIKSSGIQAGPVIAADGAIYVGFADPGEDNAYLHALNPNGTLKWKSTAGILWDSRAFISIGLDDTIYTLLAPTSDGNSKFCALNPGGTMKWSRKYPYGGVPTIAQDGTIYASFWDYCETTNDSKPCLYALNSNNTVKWKHPGYKEFDTQSSCIGADGTIYLGINYLESYTSGSAYLCAVRPDGSIKWQYETGSSSSTSPVIGPDGTLYMNNYFDGYLYAINTDSSGPAPSPWPMDRHDYQHTARFKTPPPLAKFIAKPLSGLAPLLVKFSNASTGKITGFSWDFGDGSGSTAASASHTYQNPGAYNARLTVTGPGGSNTMSTTITATPRPPVVNFTDIPHKGQAPLTVQFNDLSTGIIQSRVWDFGDGTTDTSPNPSHTFNPWGTYKVRLTVTGPGGTKSKTAKVIAVRPPKPKAAFTPTPAVGPAPLMVQFTDASTGLIDSRSWSFGDGSAADTTPTPGHTYNNPGKYKVKLTLTGPGGSVTKSATIKVTAP
jgi:large repetitive protein